MTPLPVASFLNVGIDGLTGRSARIDLVSIDGRRVAHLADHDLDAGHAVLGLDLSYIPAGVYMLRVDVDGDVVTWRVVVSR